MANHTKNAFDTSPLPFDDLAPSNECHTSFNGSMLHSFHNPATHCSVGGYEYDMTEVLLKWKTEYIPSVSAAKVVT